MTDNSGTVKRDGWTLYWSYTRKNNVVQLVTPKATSALRMCYTFEDGKVRMENEDTSSISENRVEDLWNGNPAPAELVAEAYLRLITGTWEEADND